MAKRIGQVLDEKYRITNALAGGMAYVYLLENIETGERRAAKTVRDEFLEDSAMIARFRREMRIWVGIGNHPNIVRAFFVKEIEGNPFLFMELVDGGSLADMINKKVSLPVERLLQIAEGIAVGLDHVHNCLTSDGIRGIIHRDLTPANVLLTRNDEVKVSDFGLANAVGNTLLTKTCDMLGTFPYISPEQFDSSHDVDKRTDIYSFGALMYHLSCGIPPFRGENWNDVSGKIKEQVPVAPAKLREDLPGAFSNMLMQCLEKKAEDRFQDFADIIALLNLHLQTNGVSEKVADSTCSLSRLLDAAEGEAASAGSALVEPTHLLLAVTTLEPAMLSCWFQETDLNGQDFADNLRRRIQGKHIEGNPQPLHYRRSTLRVVALARAFSEDDGGLHARHILQALLQELSIQEMMGQALHMVDAPNGAMARLLDIIKRKK